MERRSMLGAAAAAVLGACGIGVSRVAKADKFKEDLETHTDDGEWLEYSLRGDLINKYHRTLNGLLERVAELEAKVGR